jgi:alanine racemase
MFRSEIYPSGMMDDSTLRGSWYEIDLGAVRHNYQQLRECLPKAVKIYACLKRNGYGCGAAQMAAALASEGAHGFAVASILDAVSIRKQGVDRPILLYPGALPIAAPMIEALDLTISISSIQELDQWRSKMSKIRAFIKVDLGFFRAGTTPREAGRLLALASACRDVQVEGIYAHMSELPTSKPTDAADQLARMYTILNEAESEDTRPAIVMMSSTEGVLNYPDMDFDAVDPGALLVGLPETDNPARHISLRPALKTISTSLVSVKKTNASLGPVPEIAGFHAGMILGVLGFGWGDGFPRKVPGGAQAIVGGKRVPILPPAHLEHLRVDLTDVPSACFGDQVVLLGRQGDEHITHEEVASLWGTDMVGLYAHLRDHVPRIYI